MNKNLLLGLGRFILPIPRRLWQREVARSAADGARRLHFMTADHQRVRDCVVLELPRAGCPLPPERIAAALDLPAGRVTQILDELEARMIFLYRNAAGAVTWAYPVTIEPTPHRITFSTGEQVYAAWAVDAMATPFVQGQLRGEPLQFNLTTECAHSARPIHIAIDSRLNTRVLEAGARPLVFVPSVDFDRLEDSSIIDAFWRKSVFFWSEEQAKEYRRANEKLRGTYFTLAQMAYMIPPTQGALFGFPRP